MRALDWSPGHFLDIREINGPLVINPNPSGTHRVTKGLQVINTLS